MLQVSPYASEAPETATDEIGVRLAIMQRLLGLRCTESLVADATAALDADLQALVGEDIIAFNATSEIYGSARMLLVRIEAVRRAPLSFLF